MGEYNRTISDLEKHACKWWPDFLVSKECESSILPLLLDTQDKFISVLTLSDSKEPDTLFDILDSSKMSVNLFLKHLMVITDFGSEPLQRLNRDFKDYFPNGKLNYVINGQSREYVFSMLPVKGTLTNSKMNTDASKIRGYKPLNDFYRDIITLLLYGSNSVDDRIAEILNKCNLGNILGDSDSINQFIKQRYIFVSRIIGGAQANSLGNIAQNYVVSYLKEKLGFGYEVSTSGHIPGITQNDGVTLMSFDAVVKKGNKYAAIEISFQVTTNSVIERKAGQAKNRYDQIKKSGNCIAYVIDGAGNFQRISAVSTICNNSDCTVAYSDSELNCLSKFIMENLQ